MISINNLQKKYKDFSLNLSMEVPAGTVTGLVGRNGAGKSTVIKAILGLIEPDAGEVRVFGKNPRSFTGRDKEAIGTVLTDSDFSKFYNVKDVYYIFKSLYPAFDGDRFMQLCKDQKLPFRKSLRKFSTGMRTKLRIISAITHDAKLLVLDEPTAGLDVLARTEMLGLLRDYLAADEERSIIITSHISTDLEGFCDDIWLIDDGRIVFHEETDALLDRYGVLKVSNEQYAGLDKQYLLAAKVEPFGYACLTNEKQYYLENYPGIITEQATLDSAIILLTGGRFNTEQKAGEQ
ncbi:MAG: ABC transporter ATP-binding protein [Lachnospiraceae bacterium]|nr:ABC transporter ATP-binding protein [Lachnospiraceae bacterium]